MNKKILSIFALIMAISILGVSCADNNTTKPEDQKPATLTAEEQKEILKAIGTLQITASSGNADFVFDENKEVTASGSTYTVEEVVVGTLNAAITVNYVDIIPVIQAKDFSSVKGVTINKNAAKYQKVTSDAKKVKVIIPFTKGETTGTIVLQLSGDTSHASNDLTFVAKEVTADDVQNAVKAAFADMKVGTTGALPAIGAISVSYTSGTATIAKGSSTITDSSKATVLQVLNDANATTAGSYKKLQSELDKIGLTLEDITDFVDSTGTPAGKGSVKFADVSAASTATIGKDAAIPAVLTLTAKDDYVKKSGEVTDLKVVITINQDAWGK